MSKDREKRKIIRESYNLDELDRRQSNGKPSEEEKPKDEDKNDEEKN